MGSLKRRGYDEARVQTYMAGVDTLLNLQLLTEAENLAKGATPFDEWLGTRDAKFRSRHRIPPLSDYGVDRFVEFAKARREMVIAALKEHC